MSEDRVADLANRMGLGFSVASQAIQWFYTLIAANAQSGRSIPLIEAVAVHGVAAPAFFANGSSTQYQFELIKLTFLII